ncbi:hypothetical protein P3W45_001610 [Vairimorpha bombi]|jgi:G2/mitotic-specific cyclin 2
MIKRVFHDITNVSRKNFKLTIHKSSHRKKLIRWLYEVTRDFKYSQATFAISIYILDSYTQKCGFDLNDYQLIGITSLFVGAKIDEKLCKSIDEYVAVTDNYAKKEEIINLEREILKVLDFDIKIPHLYLKTWYLKKMSSKFTLLERREILFSAFAYIMEKNICKNNMYWIYLEGIREAEKLLSCKDMSEELKFYIENNRVTKNINFGTM